MQIVWGLNLKQFCGGFKGLPLTIFGVSGPRLCAGFATKGLKLQIAVCLEVMNL